LSIAAADDTAKGAIQRPDLLVSAVGLGVG
jgi:hypothetical protein